MQCWTGTLASCWSTVSYYAAQNTKMIGISHLQTSLVGWHRVLESENGAQNVASLDGFVSLGKSSVTKKEF